MLFKIFGFPDTRFKIKNRNLFLWLFYHTLSITIKLLFAESETFPKDFTFTLFIFIRYPFNLSAIKLYNLDRVVVKTGDYAISANFRTGFAKAKSSC